MTAKNTNCGKEGLRMKDKLGKRLLHSVTKNIGLKLLALFFSFGLWFVVNNINDPIDSKSFYGIPVEIINADLITNEGKVYEVLDSTDVVSLVKVKGKTSAIKYITKDDIKATADLSELTFMNTVNIKITSTRNNSELEFTSSIDNLKLKIEDIKRVQLAINASTSGQPAEGYIVGNVTPAQNIVRISGPESIIEQIDRVEAVANIGNYAYTTDINTSVDLVLKDAEGNEIKNNAIKMNISSTNVSITILATKEVPLKFNITGEPAEGYILMDDLISVPETITIAGRKVMLDTINELVISDETLDISEEKEDKTTIVNVKKALPIGTQFADTSFGGNVSVTIPIEELITKEYEVPVKNFAVANIPDGYEAKIAEFEKDVDFYKISVQGIEKDINSLKEKDIIGVVDLEQYATDYEITEWNEGSYVLDVIWNMTDDYKLTDNHKLTVQLNKIEE